MEKISFWLLILGGVMTLLGTYFWNLSSSEGQKKLVDAQNKVIEAQEKLAKLQEQNFNTVRQSLDSAREILNEQQQKSAEQISSLIDISKKVKFPLPNEATVRYSVIFRVNETLQKQVDQAMNIFPLLDYPPKGHFRADYGTALKKLIINSWSVLSNDVQLIFSRSYKESGNDFEYEFAFLLSNRNPKFDFSRGFDESNITVWYDASDKLFQCEFNFVLKRDSNTTFMNVDTEIVANSIFDLNGTRPILNQEFPEQFDVKEINMLLVSSNELNVRILKLTRSGDARSGFFISTEKMNIK